MKSGPSMLESRPRFYALLVVTFIMGVAWIVVSAADEAQTTSGQIPSPRQGFLAPDFSLNTLEGQQITLSELRGDPIIVNLWASWCPPCRAEMPAIQKVYDQNQARGLQVLAVNMTYQDSETAAEAFVQEYELSFPVLLDMTGMVGNGYQMRALPSTYFIDREGIIQQVIIGGPMSEATLQSAVEALFEGGS
ncbi:MAG: TlpA disulfide reductase family protein [Anaerolineales bacterium]